MTLTHLAHPAPGRPVTSGYGMRKNPITGETKKHRGLDFGGTFPVRAAAAGVVVEVIRNLDRRIGYGHGLVIQHAPDLFTLYAHGAAAPALRVGAKVQAGDVLFTSGASGAATGPHLHFEVRKGRAWGTDVDPTPYLAAPPPAPAPAPGVPTHTVARGETLSTIAKRYGMTWQALYALNRDVVGSNPNRIFAGQVLRLGSAPAPAPAPKPAPAPAPKPAPAPRRYTVQRGDTLSKIAARHGTTWQAIYALNRATIGSNPNRIFAGQVLTLP